MLKNLRWLGGLAIGTAVTAGVSTMVQDWTHIRVSSLFEKDAPPKLLATTVHIPPEPGLVYAVIDSHNKAAVTVDYAWGDKRAPSPSSFSTAGKKGLVLQLKHYDSASHSLTIWTDGEFVEARQYKQDQFPIQWKDSSYRREEW